MNDKIDENTVDPRSLLTFAEMRALDQGDDDVAVIRSVHQRVTGIRLGVCKAIVEEYIRHTGRG